MKILIVYASILLLQYAAPARPTNNGLSPTVYAQAKAWDLNRAIVDEMWISRRPWFVTATNSAGEVTRWVYEITPNGRKLLRKIRDESRYPVAKVPDRPNYPPVAYDYWQTTLRHFDFFNNAFLNRIGLPSSDNIFHNFFRQQFPRPPPCFCPPCFSPSECRPINVPAEEQPKLDEGDLDYVPEQNPIGNPSQPSVPHETKPIWFPVSDKPSLPTLAPKGDGIDTAIEDFLEKHRITVADIENEDGELVKTIVNKQGRVLSVSFKLGNGTNEQPF
ncbi:uncharacterized protein LOC108090061 [Drosophila ficusphila]|uniref:uncharacterized protein LOC108090061 n=1 Tax=Drosophila ficusphila TaxID=30025 RepID=UPI0007E81067|nr:uncharacterized protein LOC108090061 [Drosophila ficusphila]